MLDFPRWKIWLVALTVIVGVLFSVPSFLPERVVAQLPAAFQARINLGLDLSGGRHILLEAATSDVAKLRLEIPGKETLEHIFHAPGDIDDILELP